MARDVLAITSCSAEPAPTSPGPEAALAEFVEAWQQFRPDDAAAATSDPPEAAQVLDEAITNLRPEDVTISPGAVTRTAPDTATTQATVSWVLPDAGTWTYSVDWTWRQADGDVGPRLVAGGRPPAGSGSGRRSPPASPSRLPARWSTETTTRSCRRCASIPSSW